MSLITSRTAGSTTSSYFLQNVGSDAAPTVPTSSAGVVLIDSVAGTASVRSDGTTLTLGGTSASAPVTITAAITSVSNTLACLGQLGVAGPSAFQSSISLEGQQVQNNLRYQQPFGPIPDGANDQPLGSAQPVMLAGSYAITAQITSAGGGQIQPSAIGVWNGTQWTAGANGAGLSFPGGGVAVAFRPAPDGASLVMSNASGAPVSGFIYYVALGEN